MKGQERGTEIRKRGEMVEHLLRRCTDERFLNGTESVKN